MGNVYHPMWFTKQIICGPDGVKMGQKMLDITEPNLFGSIWCFDDWFKKIVLPWANSLGGVKVVIGDNLASHLSVETIQNRKVKTSDLFDFQKMLHM